MRRRSSLSLLLAFSLVFTGCSQSKQRSTVPPDLVTQAEIPGFRDIRYTAIVGEDSFFNEEIDPASIDDSGLIARDDQGRGYYSYLVLTAGGSNGAFAAGFLNGWSQSGQRPNFKVVTGVSSGAMIATFAFLGSQYDQDIEEFYTHGSASDIFEHRSKLALLTSNSVSTTEALWCMIQRIITPEIVEKVAAEHRRGRRLYVGTTNLDIQRLVVWDMGKIANQGGCEAVDLYRRVLYASTAIPVYFPPVYFNVLVDQCCYEEMHVDGAVVSHVMAPEGAMDRLEREFARTGITPLGTGVKLYVIRNGAVRGDWACVPDRLRPIANQTVDTTIMHHSLADLHRLWAETERKGIDFNVAHIPFSYHGKRSGIFAPDQMKRLYHVGLQEARLGYEWKKSPPLFQP